MGIKKERGKPHSTPQTDKGKYAKRSRKRGKRRHRRRQDDTNREVTNVRKANRDVGSQTDADRKRHRHTDTDWQRKRKRE